MKIKKLIMIVALALGTIFISHTANANVTTNNTPTSTITVSKTTTLSRTSTLSKTATENPGLQFENEEEMQEYIEGKVNEALEQSDLADFLEEKLGISIVGFVSVFSGFIASFSFMFILIRKYVGKAKDIFAKAKGTIEEVAESGKFTEKNLRDLVDCYKTAQGTLEEAKADYIIALERVNGMTSEFEEVKVTLNKLLEVEKVKILNNIDALQDGVAKKIASVINDETKSKE